MNAPLVPLPVSARHQQADSPCQYLAFTLNGETFAIDILQIREIIELGPLTPVPLMPPALRGVINLRGTVVPVIDLSARLGRGESPIGRRSCIVILEVKEEDQFLVLGILVDGVSEVLEIPASAIEAPPAFGTSIRTDFIAGMAQAGSRFTIILDIGKVLEIDELARLAAAGQEGTGKPPPGPSMNRNEP